MKNKNVFGCSAIIALLIFFMGCEASAQATSDVSSVRAEKLLTEYLTDPLGIDVEKPRFSWVLVDDTHARGQSQTAYQVLVASTESLLAPDQADIWNSGKVSSDQSAFVPFEGEPLLSGEAYYWKVRVWGKDQQPSAWSEPARFSMGLLAAEDWKGSWIQHPDAPAESHIWYRKNVSLDSEPSTGFIHVASMGYHELYVNGEKVDNRVLAPSLTRMDKRVHYVTYDIADMLAAGDNTIAVWYGPGWSRYNFFQRGTKQILKVQFNGRLSDGSAVEFASDSSWRCQISSSQNIGPIRYGNHGGERIDARRYLPDWNTVGFDDSAWPLAREVDSPVALSAEMSDPSRVIETLPAQGITGDNPYRVDMGRNFTGWIEIKMEGQSAGDEITIKVANQPHTQVDFNQISHYICSGDEAETYSNRFNYIAGRWITIEGLKNKPELSDITGYAISTDMERIGHFNSSNELLNQIYETDLWTFMANTTEGFTADCPHRERLGYGEVGFATAWGIGLPNYRSGAFTSKIVRDWTDMQESSGWIHHTVPQTNQHYGGPMWSSSGLNIAWETYQTYGDKRILESAYETTRRWLEFLHANVSEGLLQNYAGRWTHFLGEWAHPDHDRTGKDREQLYFNNCVYALNLRTFVGMAEILENEEDVAQYKPRLEALKKSIHEEFFDAGRNIYVAGEREGRQVDMAFALMLGLPPEHLRPEILANFEKELGETRPYLDMGSSGLPVLLKFITEDYNRGNIVYGHLNKTTQPSYGHFLERGETTWPEYWNVDVASRIHTCYTGIASYFIKSLAGIRPDPAQPGFQSFLIEPLVVGDLEFAEGETQSIYGRISSRWELSGSGLELAATIPPNSQATVSLPTLGTPADALVIKEGGHIIWENDRPASSLPAGIAFSRREGGDGLDSRIAWTVGSGNYRFTALLLGAPDHLEAVGAGDEITLKWSASPGAAAYSVGRAVKSGGPYETIASGIDGTRHSDSTVTRDRDYFYVVIPEGASGAKGAPSPEASGRSGLQGLRNHGFEEPRTNAFVYNPEEFGWTFTPLAEHSGSGVAANQSPFTADNPEAPEGRQVAFLQGNSSISQVIDGFVPGATYRVDFKAAQRKNKAEGGQTWDLHLDDKPIERFEPPATDTSYKAYHAEFTATEPRHTLGFIGTNERGGDNTVFIDQVEITLVSE